MRTFRSVYGPMMDKYLQFKRSLGYKIENPTNLFLFDAFAIENNLETIGLFEEQCKLWSKKRPNEKNTTCYSRTNAIRNLCLYLLQNGYETCIPKYTVKPDRDFIPYVFTKDEIQRFFKACDSLITTPYSNTAYVYPALFRLLLGTGIRISEAIKLKMSDFNFDNNTFVLRETKNGEERIIPFSNSLSDILHLYINKHRKIASNSDYFFVKKDISKLTSDCVYKWFRKIIKQAGIPHGGRSVGPNVHSFRHTFSVHSLAKMDDLGLDLYYALPILSKYLGHKTLEATEKYVRLTEEMYPGIMNQMNQLCSYVFPEVVYYETY